VSAAKLAEFQKHPINLAAGGIRLPLKTPVVAAELALMFLSLGDQQGIICAMAEVVWTGRPAADGMQPTGLRFLNILEHDQQRIDRVVGDLLKHLEKVGG
jgi:c-di-GMP-binding flagellar brake protein YcgR